MRRPRNELTREQAAVALGKISPMTSSEKRSKYNAKKTTLKTFFGEHTFDSAKESRFYEMLMAKKSPSDIVLCQVPLRLPGKTKYVVDFLFLPRNGAHVFYDVKGIKTAMYQLKKRQVQEIYGIDIVEV